MVQILYKKAGVFEADQCPQIQDQSQCQKQLRRCFVPELINAVSQDKVDQGARDNKPQEGNISAGIKQQGKDDEHCIAVGRFLCGKIAEKTDGEE